MENKLTTISEAFISNQIASANHYISLELSTGEQVERLGSLHQLVATYVTCHKDETPEVIKENKNHLYDLPRAIQAKMNKRVDSVTETVGKKVSVIWKPTTDKNGKVQKHMSEAVLKKLQGNLRQCYSRVLKDLGMTTTSKVGGNKKRAEVVKLEDEASWQTVEGVKQTIARFSDMVKTPAFLAMMSDKKIQGSVLAITATMTSNAEFFAVEKPASEVSKTVKKGNRTKHTIGK